MESFNLAAWLAIVFVGCYLDWTVTTPWTPVAIGAIIMSVLNLFALMGAKGWI